MALCSWHQNPVLMPLAHCQTALSSAGDKEHSSLHAETSMSFIKSFQHPTAPAFSWQAVLIWCWGGRPPFPAGASPYASISATLGWETFHMVHTLWLGLMELPVKAPDKDWDMQVSTKTAPLGRMRTL